MRTRWLILPLLLVVSGCGERGSAAGQPQPDPLRGLTFVAGELNVGGTPRALVAGTEVTVEFTDDGRLIANAGCNMMQGQVDTADGKLTVHELASTGMGCDTPRHEQDGVIAEVLGATPTWRRDGDQLEIVAGDRTLTLTEKSVAKPDRPLVGTTWTLDTMADGQTAQSIPTSVPPVTATFDEKKFRVDTHCNGVGGEYTVDGDTITITLGPSTLMACDDDRMLVESTVAQVLRDGVTFDIDADLLTLTAPSGKELQLHAS